MYFDDWKKSVMKRSGYDDKERSKMMIPQETRDGIYITGKSSHLSIHLVVSMLCCSIIIC